jgi:predicted short-subunit dehydrogenase-like oxidoreductase (DUF2520 family)
MLTFGFIGAGRLGSALAVRLHDLGYPITGILSRSHPEPLAQQVDAPVVTTPPLADILFLTVPDGEIQNVAAQLAESMYPGAVVHTSGVHSLDVLGEISANAIGSFHPLYAFRPGTRLTGSEGMLVGIEASNTELAEQLKTLAREIGGNPAILQAGQKTRYHAAAVIASNYLVTLYDISEKLLEEAGISEAAARPALLNIMAGVIENLRALPPNQALTGPIARGDIETIAKHLENLNNTPYRPLYTELGRQTLPVASNLSDSVRQKLVELFS